MATKLLDRIIYKTTNLVNGLIYVGQDSYNNPKYLGSGVFLKRDIIKYGKSNFKKEILCKCKTSDELDKMEIYWIDKLNTINKGYNLLKGGKGNSSNEYIDKMSISLRGFKNPMYKSSVKEKWIKKYGLDKATKMWNESNKKRSINATKNTNKKVKVFNIDNILVNEFNSLKEASLYTEVGYKYIKNSNKNNKSSKGFYFKY